MKLVREAHGGLKFGGRVNREVIKWKTVPGQKLYLKMSQDGIVFKED